MQSIVLGTRFCATSDTEKCSRTVIKVRIPSQKLCKINLLSMNLLTNIPDNAFVVHCPPSAEYNGLHHNYMSCLGSVFLLVFSTQ